MKENHFLLVDFDTFDPRTIYPWFLNSFFFYIFLPFCKISIIEEKEHDVYNRTSLIIDTVVTVM